jgi:hypothetical protein
MAWHYAVTTGSGDNAVHFESVHDFSYPSRMLATCAVSIFVIIILSGVAIIFAEVSA